MLFARMREIIKYDVFDGIRLLSRYSVHASDGDTAILIKHVDWRNDKI